MCTGYGQISCMRSGASCLYSRQRRVHFSPSWNAWRERWGHPPHRHIAPCHAKKKEVENASRTCWRALAKLRRSTPMCPWGFPGSPSRTFSVDQWPREPMGRGMCVHKTAAARTTMPNRGREEQHHLFEEFRVAKVGLNSGASRGRVRMDAFRAMRRVSCSNVVLVCRGSGWQKNSQTFAAPMRVGSGLGLRSWGAAVLWAHRKPPRGPRPFSHFWVYTFVK